MSDKTRIKTKHIITVEQETVWPDDYGNSSLDEALAFERDASLEVAVEAIWGAEPDKLSVRAEVNAVDRRNFKEEDDG